MQACLLQRQGVLLWTIRDPWEIRNKTILFCFQTIQRINVVIEGSDGGRAVESPLFAFSSRKPYENLQHDQKATS